MKIFVVTICDGGGPKVELFTKPRDAMEFAKDQAEDWELHKIKRSGTTAYWENWQRADDDEKLSVQINQKIVDECVD